MCNLLTYRKIDYRSFCGLMNHYRAIGIDPAMVVTMTEVPAAFLGTLSQHVAMMTHRLSQTGEANQDATIRYCDAGFEFHWYGKAELVIVYRVLPNNERERVFLKTADKPINAIG